MSLVRITCVIFLILSFSQTVQGQVPIIEAKKSKPNTPTAPKDENLEEKQKKIGDELRIAEKVLKSAKKEAGKNEKPPEKLQAELELLKQLKAIVAQHEAAKNLEKDLHTKLTGLQGQLETVRSIGPRESKPYSFLLLDRLKDELTTRQARSDINQDALKDTEQAVLRAKETLKTKQQAARKVKSELQVTKDVAEKQKLSDAIKLANAAERIAVETVELKKQERANEKLTQQIQATKAELLTEKINWISKDVEFSQNDLETQFITLEKRESDLKSVLKSVDSNLAYAEREWSRAKQEADMAMKPSQVLIEQVEAWQLARQRYQQEVSVLNARLQRIAKERELWNLRYKVLTAQAKPEELITWADESRQLASQLEREKRLQQMRIDELRREVAAKDNELQSGSNKLGNAKRWIESQREHLSQTLQLHDSSIVSIESTLLLNNKLLTEIEGDVDEWSFSEWAGGLWHYVKKVWNFEITSVDDNPLTIGKIIVGIILIVLGFIFSRKLSRILGSRLHQRFGVNANGASVFQSLSFYTLLIMFTLTILRYVNVPLTMFTFLGGALAIGVGFGSQKILNNFVSGLILMAERPIRVGDLIQLGDLHGTIEHIGTRSTRVRTGTNLEIIVPNSSFLENNVLNLTLSDNQIRTSVKVGIAYGSSTRDAARLLKYAADEHGLILKKPEPFVWFVDFGDNSLAFELNFWIQVISVSERKRIESDMRFKIDQLFREAGIVIAYPQRDVHLNVNKPVDIRMLREKDTELEESKSEKNTEELLLSCAGQPATT